MKRTLFFLLITLAAFAVQAQEPAAEKKACCQAKATSASLSDTELKAAVLLASQDEAIEVRKDDATGSTQFVRKQVCPMSGSVSYVNVNYDAAQQTFVNVAPQDGEGAACTGSQPACAGKECPMGCCAGKTGSAAPASQTIKASETKVMRPGLKTAKSKSTKVQ
ncbi:MAG: hypothetical protein R2806_22090 [Saprospiraceae bacterium]